MDMASTLKSFVKDSDDSLFSIHNLPYGVFIDPDTQKPHIGTAIGIDVLDLTRLEAEGMFSDISDQGLFNQPSLNYFASKGQPVWSKIRKRIQSLLNIDNPQLQDNHELLQKVLIPAYKVEMVLPFSIEGFTDFYASENHASNVGRLFRGNENPLLPNWKYLPVGYNGRPSTVFVSGTKIQRPSGLIKLPDQEAPIFSSSRKLDFELEMGFFVGSGNPDRQPISVKDAESQIFGLVLLNDWSARDIQAFEYQPLGPFLSKSFGTSISPWVVPYEAIQETMTPLPEQNPRPADYLYQPISRQPDIRLKVEIQPKGSSNKTVICETSSTELYWSMEQMLAHHTVNNCIMKPGDLLGTGTISGPERQNWGSLLEISFNGKQPLILEDGTERTFLENGDRVIFTGYCDTPKGRIGFGVLEGTIVDGN